MLLTSFTLKNHHIKNNNKKPETAGSLFVVFCVTLKWFAISVVLSALCVTCAVMCAWQPIVLLSLIGFTLFLKKRGDIIFEYTFPEQRLFGLLRPRWTTLEPADLTILIWQSCELGLWCENP
jgi:hypothetical protein